MAKARVVGTDCHQCGSIRDHVECMVTHADNGYGDGDQCGCECHKHTFVLYPGNVKSKHDGDWHWVSTADLQHLYKVPLDAEILIVDRLDPDRIKRVFMGRGKRGLEDERYIHLYPNHTGNYRPVTGIPYRRRR